MSVWRLQYEIDEGAHVPYARSLCILHHGRVEHLIPPPPRGRPRRAGGGEKATGGFPSGRCGRVALVGCGAPIDWYRREEVAFLLSWAMLAGSGGLIGDAKTAEAGNLFTFISSLIKKITLWDVPSILDLWIC
ncbi:hypothetical protein Zmor_027365 [Zophobas morio]|uniref:Uncharacterized protein n=1 Tax=Zophobas morio TaxID=2755281 RepID=A0AA38HQF5_9CUCU|nr:hypothetical protein Zmor_027365 [Zophobas morio]